MSNRINRDVLKIGDVFHVRTNKGFWPWMIRNTLDSWGNHDAPVLEHAGRLVIGDVVPGGAKLTEIAEYQKAINSGLKEVRVYRVEHVTESDRLWANSWWLENVLGRPYDYLAYGRLLLKAMFGDLFKAAAGWEWAWWCSETCSLMWLAPNSAGETPWGTRNPTPRTGEKRVVEGKLKDISRMVFTAKENDAK